MRGETTRYVVEEIEYCSDPPDMFHATVSFAPRSEAELRKEWELGQQAEQEAEAKQPIAAASEPRFLQ